MRQFSWLQPDEQFAFPESELTVSTPDLQAYRKAADFYYRQYKDWKQRQNVLPLAINEYAKDAELHDNPDTMAQLAKCYALNGQFDRARHTLAGLQDKSDTLSRSVKKKMAEVEAFLAVREGRTPDALQALSWAIRYETAFWRTGKYHLSLAGLRLSSTSTGGFRPLHKAAGLGNLFLGTILSPFAENRPPIADRLRMGWKTWTARFIKADAVLSHYLELYQQYPGAEHLGVAIGKHYLENDCYSEAEFWFKQACERHPLSDEGYRCLALLYQTVYDVDPLIDTLKKWLAIRPNASEILLALSQAQSQLPEQLEEAASHARQALLAVETPQQAACIYNHLGSLYALTNTIDLAILSYQAAINLQPGMLESYIQLGTLYYEKQEFTLARETFRKALTLSPNNARILCNMGYLAWMDGDIREALAYYHQSIATDASYDIALNNLGVLYLDHVGDIERAMNLFDQTLQYNPEYALCYYNKGRAYSFLGKAIEAAQCFQRARELNVTTQELDNRELTERIRQLFEDNPSVSNTDL